MSEQHRGYQVAPFPLARRLIADSRRVGRRRGMIHGLFEVDVTETRRLIRAYRARTGQRLSLTTFVIACLSRAVAEDRRIQAIRSWRGQLYIFDDVDVMTIIELRMGSGRFPLAHVLRSVQSREFADLQAEIEHVSSHPWDTPTARLWGRWGRFLLLPAIIRQLIYRFVLANPHWVKKYIGTVAVTAPGVFGGSSGWGIGLANHTLGLTLGGVGRKPGVVNGEIAVREYLSITLHADHAIIDGAPAARFVRRLKHLIETGYGLDHCPDDEGIESRPFSGSIPRKVS